MILPTEFSSFNSGLNTSREKLLNALKDSSDITFIYGPGNIGDHLIWEGSYQLLGNLNYKKVFRGDSSKIEGDTAVLTGGGGWCSAFHSMPSYLRMIEQRFKRVIVFPTSFDTSLEDVKRTLSQTNALVFARELKSYQLIKDLCNADYAYDTAFFYDFESFKKKGDGTLNAYRVDRERKPYSIPKNNNDISVTCKNLQEWLRIIASYQTIYTDRAHVTIASALLGKQVFYRHSNYHKVQGIVEFSLKDFPVIYKD
jgi:exopolysaccharide biosynthesis predicted pyruvyltransferase EpsI